LPKTSNCCPVLTDVHWWVVYSPSNTPPALDDFTIRFFAEDAGAPAANPLAEFQVGNVDRTDTGANVLDFDVYAYSVDIAPLALAANTTYWVSIVNDTSADTDDNWYWSSLSSGNAFGRIADTSPWGATTVAGLGFQLTDDTIGVPEPTTLVLFGFGLAGLGFLRRRRAA
jgi:hypothetical protein